MLAFLRIILKNSRYPAIMNMKNQEDSLERKTQVVKKSYKAMVIAKYIVNKCTREGQSVSNLQLQKILFFAQGEFYKNYGRPLFQDDIQAWQYGPVVPDVYNKFCSNGASPIYDLFDVDLDPDTASKLDPIIENYRMRDIWELVALSHAEGGPWAQVYTGLKDVTIPKNVIREYFLTSDRT